jgi:ribonuclease G
MSKELVISAASHERRVAILEEGQLVEIYIEREKEFALVGSIYKGKVTRVLPGMQSAFVDIGLDGDAFLYVSDVFENLEDYDHGHPHEQPQVSAPPLSPAIGSPVEVLPGESLARAAELHEEAQHEQFHHDEAQHADEPHASHQEAHASEGERLEEHRDEHQSAPIDDQHAEAPEERQPDSNASAPQNFAPHYNPTQNYPARGASDRPGQNFGRGGDRGADRGGDRGGDRGRGGRWGRRGGRSRGGRPPGGPGGGRNLPPSKYASPQGGESRGYDNRGGQPRSYDNRRPEAPRSSAPSVPEDEIVLPGESLAKYRGKPVVALSPVPSVEHETREEQNTVEEITPRAAGNLPATAPSGSSVPRRFSGGLPRWLLADASTEPEAAPAGEAAGATQEASAGDSAYQVPSRETTGNSAETTRNDAELNEDQVAALASGFVEAKHEETSEGVADAIVGGAEFDEEDSEEHEDEGTEEAEETPVARVSELSEEEAAEVEAGRAVNRAEFAADVAQAHAEHHAEHGTHELDEHEHDHDEHEHDEQEVAEHGHEHAETGHAEEAVIAAAAGESVVEGAAIIAEDVILLPGETRSPRVAGATAPLEDFPRDSARIGGNPRSRFQRPFRSGGRDRGRDSRGGRPDSRGGRPDSRGGRPDRGGRPITGGPRFERRPSGPGGPRHDRGYQGGRSGPSRRPQLISEMLKAGQDVVIQIAKEPLGKKGARITSHVALPGRFLVYMPTVHHTGVSRKIISADNRSRLRRLVSEAGGAYPGGFIVRTAAGGATDDEIRADIEFLGSTWNEIKERSEQRKAPSLLHRDLNLVERILRDYVSDDFTGIWIDNEEEYSKIVEFVSRFQPKLVNKVKLYTKETPIFEEFGIQHELDKALRAKVWLKSGGYIVINHTEALVAIDVNTGKFVGKGSTRLEDTIVKTNLEAVKEIVRQIRLRDLGGIIVVDFIDMEERRNREKVLSALQQALEEDKAPSKALSFNEFGLVCITRKRTKQALERVLCQPCPYCTGSGMVKSVPTLCYEIQAEARKMAAADHEGPNLTIRVNPEIAKALKTRESMLIDELEQTAHKHIIIQSDATLHWEQYDIY